MMLVNWSALTQDHAKRLIGIASKDEQQAATRFNASGSPEDESAWLAAFTLWEDLRVFAICGEKPD